jgi:hypothetical protein
MDAIMAQPRAPDAIPGTWLPDSPYAIQVEMDVPGQHREFLQPALGYEQPIEGVPVMARQIGDSQNMGMADIKGSQ